MLEIAQLYHLTPYIQYMWQAHLCRTYLSRAEIFLLTGEVVQLPIASTGQSNTNSTMKERTVAIRQIYPPSISCGNKAGSFSLGSPNA